MSQNPLLAKIEQLPFRILICDDDRDIREIVKLSLADKNYEIIEAENGVEACACFGKQQIDLVLLDIMMPQMSGTEFISWLRHTYPERLVLVMMLTALHDVSDRVAALNAGADDYLTKPFDHRELVARVAALLRTKSLVEQLETAQAELREKDKQLVASKLAGTVLHNLGQPLNAMLLNCKIAERAAAESNSTGLADALGKIKGDCELANSLLRGLQDVDVSAEADYVGGAKIFKLES